MTDAAKCARVNKWVGGCRFEARFDKAAPDLTKVGPMEGSGRITEILDASRATTYVHDICTRCGKVVQRQALENRKAGLADANTKTHPTPQTAIGERQ